jgi:hypothetical protein
MAGDVEGGDTSKEDDNSKQGSAIGLRRRHEDLAAGTADVFKYRAIGGHSGPSLTPLPVPGSGTAPSPKVGKVRCATTRTVFPTLKHNPLHCLVQTATRRTALAEGKESYASSMQDWQSIGQGDKALNLWADPGEDSKDKQVGQ